MPRQLNALLRGLKRTVMPRFQWTGQRAVEVFIPTHIVRVRPPIECVGVKNDANKRQEYRCWPRAGRTLHGVARGMVPHIVVHVTGLGERASGA
jgi:hypothetical protein